MFKFAAIEYFTIKLYHGGQITDKPKAYVGGHVDYIDFCSSDHISLIEIFCMITYVGIKGPEIKNNWYKLPKTTMDRGLFKLDSDDEVMLMCTLMHVERYVEFRNGEWPEHVSDYYKKKSYMKLYNYTLEPIVGLEFWEDTPEPLPLPPLIKVQNSRPKKKRNKKNDIPKDATKLPTFGAKLAKAVEENKAPNIGRTKVKCTTYGGMGHSKRTYRRKNAGGQTHNAEIPEKEGGGGQRTNAKMAPTNIQELTTKDKVKIKVVEGDASKRKETQFIEFEKLKIECRIAKEELTESLKKEEKKSKEKLDPTLAEGFSTDVDSTDNEDYPSRDKKEPHPSSERKPISKDKLSKLNEKYGSISNNFVTGELSQVKENKRVNMGHLSKKQLNDILEKIDVKAESKKKNNRNGKVEINKHNNYTPDKLEKIEVANPKYLQVLKKGPKIPMVMEPEVIENDVVITKARTYVKDPEDFSPAEIEEASLDASLQLILVDSLNPLMNRHVMNCKDSKHIWETIEIINEGTEEVRENKLEILTSEYEYFKSNPGEGITEVFERITAIREARDLSEISLERLYGVLKTYELEQIQQKEVYGKGRVVSTSTALVADEQQQQP
ncbi:hypothetical protein AgCh_032713 [Apium graveolens]